MTVVKRIKLQGFRGANEPFEVDLDGSVAIVGPTGSGKTTLLQSIEWALLRKLRGYTIICPSPTTKYALFTQIMNGSIC